MMTMYGFLWLWFSNCGQVFGPCLLLHLRWEAVFGRMKWVQFCRWSWRWWCGGPRSHTRCYVHFTSGSAWEWMRGAVACLQADSTPCGQVGAHWLYLKALQSSTLKARRGCTTVVIRVWYNERTANKQQYTWGSIRISEKHSFLCPTEHPVIAWKRPLHKFSV